MIKQTFSFVTGVTKYRENSLREQGIKTWEDFLARDYIEGITCRKKELYDQQIVKAKRNLEFMNAQFFHEHIPKNEQWRLYGRFRKHCGFLDIETTGLSPRSNRITTVSVFDGKRTETFINGINLKSTALSDHLSKYKMLVTFNGAMFDVPFIQAHFPKVKFNVPHMDLRWVGKKVGLTGGLKSIEKQVGISREDDVKDMSGLDAVRLWKRWEAQKDKEALDTLVKYNTEDVVNLRRLADHVYEKLRENSD